LQSALCVIRACSKLAYVSAERPDPLLGAAVTRADTCANAYMAYAEAAWPWWFKPIDLVLSVVVRRSEQAFAVIVLELSIMAARFRCETHGFTCGSLAALNKHDRNSCKKKCLRVLRQHPSAPLGDVQGFEAHQQAVNEDAMEKLAVFWETLIEATGRMRAFTDLGAPNIQDADHRAPVPVRPPASADRYFLQAALASSIVDAAVRGMVRGWPRWQG
jgi:hypothetical protein